MTRSHTSERIPIPWPFPDRSPKSAITAAAKNYTFAAGDAALLLYERGHRIHQVPVTIVHSCWAVDDRFTCKKPTAPKDDVAFLVRSENGGTLTVPGKNLRPGSVLDRIVAALDLDET